MKCGNKALKALFTLIGLVVFMAASAVAVIKLIQKFCPELLCELCDDCCEDDEDDDEDFDEEDDDDEEDEE